jgi:hypothetical protein
MDRELIRTCSSEQAAVLAMAAGKVVRVGPRSVRIYHPTGRLPIDSSSTTRYVAHVEVLDGDTDARWTDDDASDVVRRLFGPYLDLPNEDRWESSRRGRPTAA